jgi:hypothetical protein
VQTQTPPPLSHPNAFLALARRHPYAALFGLALLFRLLCGLFFSQPGYTDAYYYSNVAESLWRGRGFREDYIWNYLAHPLPATPFNNPSSTYWMPLTSILIYLSYLLTGGPSFLASQLPNMLISAGLVPLTYYCVKDIFGNERGEYYGWMSAGLMIFCGVYAPYFTLPDNFAPFALCTLLVLIFTYKALRLPPNEKRKALGLMALAGVFTGLSYLTRVDGVLLLGVALLALLANRYLFKRESALGWAALGVMALAAALTITPWLLRNLADTGQLFPGGGLKTLFMREYNDFFSATKPLDLPYYLNQTDPSPNWGIGPLLWSKLDALFQNLLIIGRPTLFFMAPLFFWGFFTRVASKETSLAGSKESGRVWLGLRAEFLPFTLYLGVLYLAMSLVFTFPSTRGSVFHSAGGLLPFFYALIFVGLDRFVQWLGTLSRPKAGPQRQRFYGRLLLVVSLGLALFYAVRLPSDFTGDYEEVKAVAAWLNQNGAGDALPMVPDVPAYYYLNHRPAIEIAPESLEVNLDLARRYGARYFMLQPNHAPQNLMDTLYTAKKAPGFKLVAQLGEVQLYQLEY